MLAFEVNDMTCGHCASTITKAVKTIDPGADVQVDLGRLSPTAVMEPPMFGVMEPATGG